jgi:hypothetical protein
MGARFFLVRGVRYYGGHTQNFSALVAATNRHPNVIAPPLLTIRKHRPERALGHKARQHMRGASYFAASTR